MMNDLVTVYGLYSTADGKVRYVGQTKHSIEKRLALHLKDLRRLNSRAQRWMRTQIEAGHEINIFEIERDCVLHEAEKRLIAWYRHRGVDLVNVTAGGEGNHGYRWTPEQLQMISVRRKGRIITPEWRANISKGSKGKSKPPEFGAKVSAARKGVKFTDEHRANIGKARAGKKYSLEQRAALSAARKGVKKSPEHAAKLRAHLDLQRQKAQMAGRTPEAKAKRSAKMKAWWASDDGKAFRERRAQKMEQPNVG